MQKGHFFKTDILVPKVGDLSRWCVIACDQYTSQPKYWEKVECETRGGPSAYNLVLPEIYLGQEDFQSRVEKINSAMLEYLKKDLFIEYKNSLIYCERTLKGGGVRRGLIGAVDLEDYDFHPSSQPLIRATEGTIMDRLPPRIKIRENAALELPHIMLLADDEENTIFGGIENNDLTEIYNTRLMNDAGSVRGFLLGEASCKNVQNALEALASEDITFQKYGEKGKGTLLFAVGDGNHSLAAAKQCYENLKERLSPKELEGHPARYALVELVNLHDETLVFKAIHRVIFGVDSKHFINKMYEYFDISQTSCDGQQVTLVNGNESRPLWIKNPPANIAAGSVQRFLDEYIKENGGRVDYIHGRDVVKELCSKSDDRVGFLLPAMEKSQLFKTVIKDGALPRKTFSMGDADDKRFYLEARKIKRI